MFLLTAVLYGGGSGIARLLLNQTDLGAVFFIPAGITIGFLLRTEKRVWWVVLLAAGVAEFSMNLLGEYSGVAQAGFVAANLIEPLVGALIIKRWCGWLDLARVRHVVWFVAAAVVLAPALGAAIGSLAADLGGPGDFQAIFYQWWLGDALGVILVGGGILVWGSSPDRRSFFSPWGLAILAATVVSLQIVFWSELPLTFIVLVGVVLAGALFGTRAVMVTAVVIAITQAVDLVYGTGPPILGIPDETALIVIKLRLAVFSLAGLLVAAEALESDRARRAEGEVRVGLEKEVTEKRVYRELADHLQQALLPTQVVQRPELDVAVRYKAGATELLVGGDWYDVFEVAESTIVLTVGDVVGNGLEASAAMGRLRTAVSVLAPVAAGPGSILASVCDYARDSGATSFATAVVAALETDTGRLTYGSAGHPPLLVIDPDGTSRWLTDGRSAPLACGQRQIVRPEGSTYLAPGSVVVGYTDGLVERRGEDLMEGLARLERICQMNHRRSIEELADLMLAEADGSADDVVVLVLRYLGPRSSLPPEG